MRMLAFGCLALAVSCSAHQVRLDLQAPATRHTEPPGFETAVVSTVVDGDTIRVEITGRENGPGVGATRIGRRYDVRLLGIDSPESVDLERPVECFGPEASAAAAALLDNAQVILVRDAEDVDRYGRLLRYVYLGDEMANARLVANGYAETLIYGPNLRHRGLLSDLQTRARSEARGLWAPEAC